MDSKDYCPPSPQKGTFESTPQSNHINFFHESRGRERGKPGACASGVWWSPTSWAEKP